MRQPKKRAFLEAYANCGTITHAAAAAGVDRHTHYEWLKRDPAYAVEFAEAEERAIESLEREVRRRAVEGVEEPVFYAGEVVGSVRRYSDNLLMFATKRFRPEYRDSHRVELDATVTHVRTNALDAEIASLLDRLVANDPDEPESALNGRLDAVERATG